MPRQKRRLQIQFLRGNHSRGLHDADVPEIYRHVETKEEALSFAVALTSSFPKYDASAPEGYFPVASPIEPTYMEETDEGFEVRLFDYEVCGCGSHPYYAIDYSVTKDGNVTELSRQKVYDSNSIICMD